MENRSVLVTNDFCNFQKNNFFCSQVFCFKFIRIGNKAHSCGIDSATNETIAIKFAACAMESRDYDEVNVLHLHFICRSFFLFDINPFIEQCVENSGLDHNQYVKCYTSELGTLLQLEAALKTKKLATPETGMIAGVPTVVYNDVIIFKSVG